MKHHINLTALFLVLLLSNCSNDDMFEIAKIQEHLDNGALPIDLFQGEIPIDSLYGKIYQEGIIFHLDTIDGTTFLASLNNFGTLPWGCFDLDIENLNNIDKNLALDEVYKQEGARIKDGLINSNKIIENCIGDPRVAAQQCRLLGEGWSLPSIFELKLMYENLHLLSYGDFENEAFWSSTESSSQEVWAMAFVNGSINVAQKDISYINIRAVKFIEE